MFNLVETTMIMNNIDNKGQYHNERKVDTMSFLGTLSPAASSVDPSDMQHSPMSSSSSPSHYYNANTMIVDQVLGIPDCMPYLEIMEQPVEKFRFRYKSEMVGTHGSLTGVNSDRIRKNTYPTVHLHNYDAPALIRCSLIQIKSDEPHAHRLVIKAGAGEKDDPHEIEVSPERGYTAIFQGMGIIHTAKKYLKSELNKKKTKLAIEELARNNYFGKLTQMQEAEIDRQAEALSKTINLNTVRLKFEAFRIEGSILIPICRPMYSHGINNLKSALTGELKIVRMDHTTTSCIGGQEIFLLVEKVTKNNIKVRFFECDEDDNETWSDYGKFSHIDVHHQYAIVFKAPPYKDLTIENTVEVFIQLERPSDGARSEPRIFKYKPTDKVGRKRGRYTSGTSESLSSTELPTTINNISLNSSVSLPDYLTPEDPAFFENIPNIESAEFARIFENVSDEYKNILVPEYTTDSALEPSPTVKLNDPESNRVAKKVVSELQARLKENPPPDAMERLVSNLFNKLITTDGNNALHTSIICEQYQHLQYILVLLSKMKHLKIADIQNNYAETALHLAVKISNPTVVDLLLPVGADPNIVDDKGNTPLHLVIYENLNLEEYKMLLDVTEIDAENYDGFTPLHLAVLKNNLKSVQMLVKANANVNAKHASNGNTALHMAVEEKSTDIVQFLLENFARLDSENYSKTTPVHMAKLLSSEGDDSVQILQIMNNYMQEKGFDPLTVKSEPEDDGDGSSSESEVNVKSEPGSPMAMEVETNNYSVLKDAEFTDKCIALLSKILDDTEILKKLAKALDFDSIATSIMKISTQRLLNYANVTGISVFDVRSILVSYGAKEAVDQIDDLYLRMK